MPGLYACARGEYGPGEKSVPLLALEKNCHEISWPVAVCCKRSIQREISYAHIGGTRNEIFIPQTMSFYVEIRDASKMRRRKGEYFTF